MSILGKAGVIRHLVLQAKAAEPPISQIGTDFIAQAPFRTDAITVANDQHADHQFGVNGRTASVAV